MDPPTRSRRVSLQLLVGAYFVLATAVLIVPGLLLAERALRRRLLDSRLSALAATMRGVVTGAEQRVAAAEARVGRLARLISAIPGDADRVAAAEFDRVIGRDPDGAWRSRRDWFDADRDAGIFLPRSMAVTPAEKAFFARAKSITERFGAGTLDFRMADAWVMPIAGGEVMYVADQPTYVWEEVATQDYSNSEWMRLVHPSTNPNGEVRWAEPYHSIKTDAWFVSVEAPFQRGGSWGGAVGQDLGFEELVDYSARTPLESRGRFLIVGRSGGILLADTTTARTPGRVGGLHLADLPDRELRDTLARMLEVPPGLGSDSVRVGRTSNAYVLWARIPATGWLVASLIPASAVEGPLSAPLRTTRIAVLLGLAALLVASLAAITREIRRRRVVERAIRRSEERFVRLFHLSPDGLGVTRLDDGRLIEVNDGFAALTGYSREQLLGRTTVELGLWARPEQRDAALALIARDGGCRHFPGILRRRDGREMEVEFSARLVEMEGEQRLLSIVRDVDEERHLERQLTQAQRMEAIGRLAGGVAHDFNNIMTAVLGYAQIASDSLPKDAPAREDLDQILRASTRAAELTRHLLAFARRQVTRPVPVDVNALVGVARKLLERLLGDHISLTTLLEPSLPPVLADPVQLEQVLVNLAVNAGDAMPGGGGVSITSAKEGEEVVLSVADTGVGISDEHQAHIFEPFFTTKELGKGTGLGLATCYGIVRQAGGRIEVRSAPGLGAAFRVILPPTAAPLPLPEADAAPETTVGLRAGSETILLAEDEPQVRQLAERMLGGLGYRVLPASDAAEALEAARTHRGMIDLLVTDVVMPGLNGRELAERLRESRPGLPVLYVSGYAADSAAIEEALRGGDGFLAKPFAATDLAQRVRQLLDHADWPPSRRSG